MSAKLKLYHLLTQDLHPTPIFPYNQPSCATNSIPNNKPPIPHVDYLLYLKRQKNQTG